MIGRIALVCRRRLMLGGRATAAGIDIDRTRRRFADPWEHHTRIGLTRRENDDSPESDREERESPVAERRTVSEKKHQAVNRCSEPISTASANLTHFVISRSTLPVKPKTGNLPSFP